MKVFLAGTSLLPTYGGPAFSVSRLATALTEAGVEVGLWAPDGSATHTPLCSADSPVQRLTGTESAALAAFGIVDIIHDNGIWLPHNHRLATLASQRNIPRVVSTRGMLEPWAMNHKRFKKRVAWALYQKQDLRRGNLLHTTVEAEAINLRQRKLGVPICTIPNGVDMPESTFGIGAVSSNTFGEKNTKTALFLGRIYPIKGLRMLVEAWARVRPLGWRLLIVGPDEAGHLAEVAQAVSAAGLGGAISFLGPLNGKAKSAAFYDADLFVLPTYSENFGMVVAEALAHGLPVLTTQGAPWPMLPERGCGWWIEPTVDGIVNGLREATSLDPAILQTMGAKGRELVAAEFVWVRVAKAFVAMYKDVIAAHRRRSFVQ